MSKDGQQDEEGRNDERALKRVNPTTQGVHDRRIMIKYPVMLGKTLCW